jgi:hypothetical protein
VREKEYWLSPMVNCLKTQRGKAENASVWERKAGIFTWGFNFAFLVGEEGVLTLFEFNLQNRWVSSLIDEWFSFSHLFGFNPLKLRFKNFLDLIH